MRTKFNKTANQITGNLLSRTHRIMNQFTMSAFLGEILSQRFQRNDEELGLLISEILGLKDLKVERLFE